MEYRQLGRAGMRVSVIGLGTNRFGTPSLPASEVSKILDVAVDLGINFLDSSNTYVRGRCEEALGQALQGRRERFIVATKAVMRMGDGPNDWGASRYHLVHALEASLRRLQTDRIDLYYLHRWDDTTPLDESLRALDDLVRMGKILYLGCSDYASWQLAKANMLAELHGWMPLVVIQSAYHLLERSVEREVLPYCRAHNVGFVPYHPVVYPDLTDNSRAGKSGTIVSFHHGERRRRYGTEPVILPTPTGRSRVALPHGACLVAWSSNSNAPDVPQAKQTPTQTLQRASTVHGIYPQTALRSV